MNWFLKHILCALGMNEMMTILCGVRILYFMILPLLDTKLEISCGFKNMDFFITFFKFGEIIFSNVIKETLTVYKHKNSIHVR